MGSRDAAWWKRVFPSFVWLRHYQRDWFRLDVAAGITLAAAGLNPGKRGLIRVNAQCRSEVPHFFAVGDVVGPPALAATGMEQARMAMCVACEVDYKDVVAPILPIGTFSHRNNFEKIAVVGNPRWEAQVLAFTGAGLREGPVKFFPETGESEARAWLAG